MTTKHNLSICSSKYNLGSIKLLIIVVEEVGHGRFEARYDGRPICISPTPFLDSARALLANGIDPSTTLVMRHAGSSINALIGKIGAAAKLRVTTNTHGTPVFGIWKASPGTAGGAYVAEIDDPATLVAGRSS
jgi:hypothetical protein